jgi:hypothetical protein
VSKTEKPTVSKPVAVIVVLALLAIVVIVIVGLVRLMGPGYEGYEGQCLPSGVSESDRDYDEMFIECSDPEARWEITKVYTSEPTTDAWSSKSAATRWLERTCDVNEEEGPAREAFVFRVKDGRGFLACAVAVD